MSKRKGEFAMLVDWVVEQWDLQVANRPPQNIYRQTLHNTWNQVHRHLTGQEIPRNIEGMAGDVEHGRYEQVVNACKALFDPLVYRHEAYNSIASALDDLLALDTKDK